MIPFDLKKIEITNDWKPDSTKEYLVEYAFPSDKLSRFLIGNFYPVWFGYSFHWFWGASSLQFKKDSRNENRDWKRIWELIRKEVEVEEPEFITEKDIEL